jgi:hypothetical protein
MNYREPYSVRSRQPYYCWWFYFLVTNAGKLSYISLALVPKNAAEFDALLIV